MKKKCKTIQIKEENIESLWDYSDLSQFLKIKPGTLRHWVHQGRLRCIKLGNLVRFLPSQVIKDLEKGIIGNFDI